MPVAGDGAIGLYTTYSLMLALFLGTMGLPHVVVRFYTNPDGRAARRTTLVVLALLGLFYLWPPVFAALGRVYGGDLIADGHADVLVLELPRLMVDGFGGELLTGLVTAGAFAAFLSTASGLAIAVSGVLTQDVTSRFIGERGPTASVAGLPAGRGVRGVGAGAWSRCSPPTSASRSRSGSRSPSPPRRSARCSCSASGGAG